MNALDQDFFISAGTNVQEGNDELMTIIHLSREQVKARWTTSKGQSILTRWRANRFDRNVLDTFVGKYYDHTDIRGINLQKENLRNANLSYVDLFCANLEDATIEKCDLTESWLSEANLSGTIFQWTKMDGVRIDNVEFNNRTNFIGVNLNVINFTLASLLQELAIGQQKIEHLERRNPCFAIFLKWTCDYGRSFARFLMCCIGVIFIFSLIYYLVPNTINSKDLLGCLYFSVVTFTTLGYGDIYPISDIGKLIIIAEVSIGYIMLGLLVAIFSRRMIVS